MSDVISTSLLLTILVGIPIAVVLTGIIGGTAYILYLFTKDLISGWHHMHHKGAH